MAVDFSAEGIKKAENRARKHNITIETRVANIADHDFYARLETFDGIIADNVLHFLTPEDAEYVLGYIKEKVKPGGYAAIASCRGVSRDLKRFEDWELYNAFDGWEIPYNCLDVGPSKDGKIRPFVEILAQKPKAIGRTSSDWIPTGPPVGDD